MPEIVPDMAAPTDEAIGTLPTVEVRASPLSPLSMGAPNTDAAVAGVNEAQADYNKQLADLQKMLQQRTSGGSGTPWFDIAGALFNPGRTGQFGEALGNASNVMGAHQREERKQQLPLAQVRLGLLQQAAAAKKEQLMQTLSRDLYTEDGNGHPVINKDVLKRMYAVDPALSQKALEGIKTMRGLLQPERVKLTADEELFTVGPDGKTLTSIARGSGKIPDDVREALIAIGAPRAKLDELTTEQQVRVRNYVDFKKLGAAGVQAYRILSLDPTKTLEPKEAAALGQAITTLRKSSANNTLNPTTISLNTQKTAEATVAEKLAENLISNVVSARTAAQTAIPTIHNARRALESGQILLGPGATTAQLLLQVGRTLGATGKNTDEVLANTRSLIQQQAQAQLAVAAGMKGQGAITEAERALIAKAAAGDLSMTKPEISAMLGAMEKTARANIRIHNQQADSLPKGSTYFEQLRDSLIVPEPTPYISASQARAEIAKRQKAAREAAARTGARQ